MDDIKRKVQTLKFWRLGLSSAIENTDADAGGKILYRLYALTGSAIMGYDCTLGGSRKAFKMMKEELSALRESEAYKVYSKLNHSLKQPVVDEENSKNIVILNQVLDYLINH